MQIIYAVTNHSDIEKQYPPYNNRSLFDNWLDMIGSSEALPTNIGCILLKIRLNIDT